MILSGCTDLARPPAGDTPAGELPEQELFGATIRFYQDDIVTSVLQAGRIRKYAKRSMILLDSGLIVDFYNQQGKHTITLWADSGRVDETRKDLKAMGNVIAKSDSGQVLETDELRWENNTRHIVSDVPVKFTSPTDTIYGSSFVSDEHLRNRQIDQPSGITFREMQKRKDRVPRTDVSKPTFPDSLRRTNPDSLR
jgi:LPS export ABC transporter protein LptC